MDVMSEKCYLCEAEKFSMEHVPARCFFPEEPEYRKDLIKVPSCQQHNENTSKDDEYVRNIICMSIGNNSVAFKQFIDKVIKSFQHSPALQSQTLHNSQKVYVEEEQCLQQTFAFQIDRDRFDKVMKKIGYALYYHEYNKVWQHGLLIATDNLLDANMQPDELGGVIRIFRPLLKVPVFNGKNPKVFQYKFAETEEGEVILWMKFYEGFEVFIIPNTGTNKPDEI